MQRIIREQAKEEVIRPGVVPPAEVVLFARGQVGVAGVHAAEASRGAGLGHNDFDSHYQEVAEHDFTTMLQDPIAEVRRILCCLRIAVCCQGHTANTIFGYWCYST